MSCIRSIAKHPFGALRALFMAALLGVLTGLTALNGCKADERARTNPYQQPQPANPTPGNPGTPTNPGAPVDPKPLPNNPGTPTQPAQNLPPHARPAIVTFTAMGCGPYNAAAEKALVRFMQLENQDPRSQFIIHLGDIVTGSRRDWPESQYAHIAALLRKGNKIPTFVIPGDNEWNDQLDPATSWKNWTKHFANYDRQWTFGPQVMRQAARPENFAFVLNGVLFIGINKVGGRIHDEAEWKTRLKHNAQWIDEHLAMNKGQVRAAVIMAQATADTQVKVPIEPAPAKAAPAGAGAGAGAGAAQPAVTGAQVKPKTPETKPAEVPTRTINLDPFFLTPLKASARKFEKPILYLHADGHKWFHIPGHWEPNILHVQLDLLDAKFPPAQITVTFDGAMPFKFNRRMEDRKWVPEPPAPAADPAKPAPAPKKTDPAKPAPAKPAPAPAKPKPTPQPKTVPAPL